MKLNKNKVIRTINLSNDMINIFNDYAFDLDIYFSNEENKKNHKELYDKYMILSESLKGVIIKNGFDKE